MTFIPHYALGADVGTDEDAMSSSALAFNSTKYPGICKPSNWATLAIFKEFQYQLNRLAQGLKLTKIAVDGDIGPGTLRLLTAIGPQKLMVDASSCSNVAAKALSLTSVAKQMATSMGVPDKVSAPSPPSPPSIVTPSGSIVAQPMSASISDAFKNMSTTTMALIGAAIIGGAYFVTRGGKKTSAAKPSVRYRTRTRTRYIRRYRSRR